MRIWRLFILVILYEFDEVPCGTSQEHLDLVCPGVIITNNQYMKSIVSVIPSDVQVINLDGMDFLHNRWTNPLFSPILGS